eukprot:2069972-Prymnesium_polylepis.1
MARSSKSSKREIKTALNACAQNTTVRAAAAAPARSAGRDSACSAVCAMDTRGNALRRAGALAPAHGACVARRYNAPQGLFLKANLEYLRQNFRKAIKLLNNSCQKDERDANVAALYFNNMGCIHHCMRRHNAAAFYFTRALKENDVLYEK